MLHDPCSMEMPNGSWNMDHGSVEIENRLFEQAQAAQQDIGEIEKQSEGGQVGPKRGRQGRRFAVGVENVFRPRLEAAFCFVADRAE